MTTEDPVILQESNPQAQIIKKEIKEKEMIPLEKLYILIHPLGMAQGVTGDRKRMVENIQEYLDPGANDLVWFMPMQIKEEIGETKRILKRAQNSYGSDDELINWPTLYKFLRNKMGREKIMLVPEIVFDRIDGDKDLIEDYIQGMVKKSEERGYEVNERTSVTLCGEAIGACLKKGAIKFLQHLPVSQVEIDLALSATSPSRSKTDAIQDVVEPVNRGVWGTNLHAQHMPATDRVLITKD